MSDCKICYRPSGHSQKTTTTGGDRGLRGQSAREGPGAVRGVLQEAPRLGGRPLVRGGGGADNSKTKRSRTKLT